MNQSASKTCKPSQGISLRTAGLFAGIGGIEAGLRRHGHETVLLSELAPEARDVLKARFPTAPLVGDIREIKRLPDCDLVAAGFPCQDLSQCGKTAGIQGAESSLVNEVFRLIGAMKKKPKWVLMENVPFMLSLDSGQAMRLITDKLTSLGYRWAYRTINAMAFGLPQRRLRVVVLASLYSDPGDVLFSDNEAQPERAESPKGFGFYWTEGATGLGWAPDSVPTLKGGSTIGIPSPPALWIPAERRLATIDIRDAERLQGFRVDWTKAAAGENRRAGVRWRLVGNAVCVRVASWIGKRLAAPTKSACASGPPLKPRGRWPNAACGDSEGAREVLASAWPVVGEQVPILDFVRFPLRPLSARATAGFLKRAKNSSLRFDKQFLDDVAYYLNSMANSTT